MLHLAVVPAQGQLALARLAQAEGWPQFAVSAEWHQRKPAIGNVDLGPLQGTVGLGKAAATQDQCPIEGL